MKKKKEEEKIIESKSDNFPEDKKAENEKEIVIEDTKENLVDQNPEKDEKNTEVLENQKIEKTQNCLLAEVDELLHKNINNEQIDNQDNKINNENKVLEEVLPDNHANGNEQGNNNLQIANDSDKEVHLEENCNLPKVDNENN